MNGITHTQARRYMLADLDDLLGDAQRFDLETHLSGCETCRAESESLSTLTSRLKNEFHAQWDAHDGPSQKVMVNVRSQTRRIVMSNRINFGVKTLAGITVLLLLGLGLNTVISQLRDHSTANNEVAAPDNTMPVSAKPEDRLLAFTKVENGNYDIYTMHADGSNLTNLTNDPSRDANPIWSRDGKRIIFESDRTGITQIHMMNADGSNMMQLTNDNTEHSLLPTDDIRFNVWSPDDSNFLFVQKESDGKTNALYSLDVNNGNRILLASDIRSIGNASWSPNGEYVGYVTWEEVEPGGFVPHLYIVDATGNNIQELSSYLAKNEHIFTPYFWASNGRSIIFPASVYEENHETIYQLDPHENTLQALMTTKTVVGLYEWYGGVALGFDSNSAGQPLVWQRPDGTSAELDYLKGVNPANCYIGKARSLQGNLVIGGYCKKDDNLSLYWTNMDGSQIQPFPEVIVPIVNGGLTGLTLSPDEKFLAFNFESENETNLYIWDVKDALENPASQPMEVSISDSARGQYFISSWQPVVPEKIVEETRTQTSDYDGLIAFTSAVEDGNLDIYTVHSDGSGLTNLTKNPAHDVNPFWTPDGKQIAFESDRTGFMQIYLMNADGSDVVQLTHDEADHALGAQVGEFTNPWSPDGSEIILSQQAPRDDHFLLYTMNISSGRKQVITDEPGIYLYPTWSFDGQYIAYVWFEEQKGIDHLYITDVNGSNTINISDLLPADENIHSWNYYWTSDSRSVIFPASRNTWENNSGRFAVYEADLDGKTLVEIAESSTPLEDWWEGTTFIRGFTGETLTWLRADGTNSELKPYENCQKSSQSGHFGFTKRSSTGNLFLAAGCPNGDVWFYWANPDGTSTKQILEMPITLTDGGISNIYWSPDDRSVAMNIVSSGITYMYILDITNSSIYEPVVIGGGDNNFYNISWQPVPVENVEEKPASASMQISESDDLIVFTADNKTISNNNMDIFTVHMDGSAITNLTHDPARDFNANDYNPIWSLDKRKIAFLSDRAGNSTGSTDVFTMASDGSFQTQLTHNRGFDAPLAWSPDGTHILYFSSLEDELDAQGQLIVMNADGGHKTLLTREPGYYHFQSWSPDGQKIVYVKTSFDGASDQVTGIHIVDIDGNNQHDWVTSNLDQIHWEDSEHFLGVIQTGSASQARWSLYRFGTDGSQRELASYNVPIVALFENTYAVDDQGITKWFTLEGAPIPAAPMNAVRKCQENNDTYTYTTHVISPDKKQAFVMISCKKNTLFYLENENGSEIQPLGGSIDGSLGLLPQWSLDGKYMSIITFNDQDPRAHSDIYLFDVKDMQAASSTMPIQTTIGKTVMGNITFGFPPGDNGKLQTKPTAQPLTFSLSVSEAELLAFFDVLEPSYLPAGYSLAGAAYDPWSQMVALKYISQQNQGVLFIYQQRGDFVHDPDVPVTSVPIGAAEGEFVRGAWIFDSPDTAIPKWDASADSHSLTWEKGEIVFSIQFIGGETIAPPPMTEFVTIAESLK